MTDHCDVCAVLDILALPFALSATSTPWLPLTDSYALTTCRRMPSRTTAFVVTVRSTPIVGCELTRYVADDDAGQAQHCCQLIWKDVTPRVTNGCWLAGWLAGCLVGVHIRIVCECESIHLRFTGVVYGSEECDTGNQTDPSGCCDPLTCLLIGPALCTPFDNVRIIHSFNAARDRRCVLHVRCWPAGDATREEARHWLD